MKKALLIVLFMTLNVCPALASSESFLGSYGLKVVDKAGCFVSDGIDTMATIGLMVVAYDDPQVDKNVVKQVIVAAAKAGCDLKTTDKAGLSPLNSAILGNSPEMVKLLLMYGANPKDIINRPGKAFNGLNSFQFVDALIQKNKNMDEIKKILNSSSFAQANNAVIPRNDYDIFSTKIPSGDVVYGVQCKNGTVECSYKWESLCKTGKAKNADPLGTVSSTPVYAKDKDKKNSPIRFFVCK